MKIAKLADNRGRFTEEDQARLLTGLADTLFRAGGTNEARKLWQAMTGFNTRLNPRISLQGNYIWSKMNNDTDGGGGFPVNSYDFTGEYGRGSGDVRHRFTLVGTIKEPT